MKEPTRLIDEDPGIARLAAALKGDGPSSEQLDKALAVATKAAAADGPPGGSSRWLGSSAGTIALAVIGVVALLGVVVAVSSKPPNEGTASSQERMAPLVTATLAPVPAMPTSPEAPVVSMRVDDLPPAPMIAPPASRARETPAAKPTFAEELALAAKARSALESGDIASCLRAVDEYDVRFRTGTFAQEIDVIRIEALAKSGQSARAFALAERFLAANPRSPYADRVRSVLENTKESP
jgi:hypothetical protein